LTETIPKKSSMMDAHARLEDLKAVAAKLSIDIETGNFADDEFPIQSGLCRVKGKNLIILDKKLTPETQAEIILQALENFDLETIYVPSWIREQLEKTQSPSDEP
jgi:hypothetical protein